MGSDLFMNPHDAYSDQVRELENRFTQIRTLVDEFKKETKDQTRISSSRIYDLLQGVESALGTHGYSPAYLKSKQEEKERRQKEEEDRSEFQRLKKKYGWT